MKQRAAGILPAEWGVRSCRQDAGRTLQFLGTRFLGEWFSKFYAQQKYEEK